MKNFIWMTNIAQMFSNVYGVDFELSSYVRFAKPLLKLVGFRYAPFELKKKCIFNMVAINELVKVENAQEKYSFSQEDHILKSQLDQKEGSVQRIDSKIPVYSFERSPCPLHRRRKNKHY